MIVDRSQRPCLLCGTKFNGRTFLCRSCSDRYRGQPIPLVVRQQFYQELDRTYPDRSNTYGEYNEPSGLLRAIARVQRSARILELGAGGGFLAEDILDLGFEDVVLSDFSSTALEELHARFPDLTVVGADASRLPFKDRTFEVVITSDVIEHLPDLVQHVQEVARVLVTGGLYLLKTPNRLLAESFYRLRGLHDYYFWHPSMLSPGELRTLFEANRFEVRFLRPAHLTAAQLTKLQLPANLESLFARLPVNVLPVGLQPHLEVIARKRG